MFTGMMSNRKGRMAPLVAAVLAVALLLKSSLALAAGAVASAHPLASRAGEEMLARGGNAFDAAVAVAATLSVVEPYASGLGGGGFWLLHRARDGRQVMVDGRETAPGAARPDMYLGADGKPVPGASLDGPLAAGIPGTPAALVHVGRRYGRLPLRVTLGPAIRHAREGFPVDARLARTLATHAPKLRPNSAAAGVFLREGVAPGEGEVLRQPGLARTLEAIAARGTDGFYRGETARRMVDATRAGGGIWTMKDLERYRVVERQPVRFRYRGLAITAASLPSAGGIGLAQALGMLERFDARDPGEPATAHLAVESLRRVFHDRARWLGDPDFATVPVPFLLLPEYLAGRAATIDAAHATSSLALEEGTAGAQTTHFSIVDGEGNRAAVTLSLNTFFGSCFVAGDTGVMLNNQMDDFSVATGAANFYGLRGGAANAIAPGKRPLSSMTPAFVEDARGVLVAGTPGGSRIVSMMLLAVLAYAAAPAPDPAAIVWRPRYHQQFLPDAVEVEPGAFPSDWIAAMEARGHTIRVGPRRWGNMQAVFVPRDGAPVAASDPRAVDYTRY